MTFEKMTRVVPEGRLNQARIEHFDVSKDDAILFALMSQGRADISPGRYARLMIGDTVWMSDTDMEQRSNSAAVGHAHGDVIIGGLGLGMVALAILRKPDVRSVTIIEKHAEVILLVEEALRRAITGTQSAGLVIWHADVATWEPRVINVHRFDYVYLDIWPHICVDDYEEHKRLRRHYRRWLKKGGTVESWQFDHLRDLKRSGRWR